MVTTLFRYVMESLLGFLFLVLKSRVPFLAPKVAVGDGWVGKNFRSNRRVEGQARALSFDKK